MLIQFSWFESCVNLKSEKSEDTDILATFTSVPEKYMRFKKKLLQICTLRPKPGCAVGKCVRNWPCL